MTNTHHILHTIREELREAREEYDEKMESVYGENVCPHCDREMETGSVGGGEVTFGCYPPHGERDRYDCPYYEDRGFAYSITRKTSGATATRYRYQGLLDLCHRLALSERQEEA